MNKGRTLLELAQELERQRESKRDLLADTRALAAVAAAKGIELGVGEMGGFGVTAGAHGQLAAVTGIPKGYYDRMLEEQPALLADNLNTWFRSKPNQHLVRTLDGKVRAVLSNKYRPLDHADLMEAVLPALNGLGEIEIRSCEVTERRLYLKVVTPRIQGTFLGQTVQAGCIITNSETGEGSLSIKDFDWDLACLNGMVREVVKRHTHLGRKMEFDGLDASEFYRDETRAASDRALFLQLQDTVKAMFTMERLEGRIQQYSKAKEALLVAPPVPAVQVIGERFALPERTRQSVLQHLLQRGDLSQWGIASAITRAAQDEDNYDVATELEGLGGKVIELPREAWAVINEEAQKLAA